MFGWRRWKGKAFFVCKRFYGRANDAYYKVYHPRKLQQDRFAEYKRESLLWVPCWALATGSPISLWAALSANVVGSRQTGCCLFLRVPHKTQKNSGTPIKMKKGEKNHPQQQRRSDPFVRQSRYPCLRHGFHSIDGVKDVWVGRRVRPAPQHPTAQGIHSFLPMCGGVFWKRLPWLLLCRGICNGVVAKPQTQNKGNMPFFFKGTSGCRVGFRFSVAQHIGTREQKNVFFFSSFIWFTGVSQLTLN